MYFKLNIWPNTLYLVSKFTQFWIFYTTAGRHGHDILHVCLHYYKFWTEYFFFLLYGDVYPAVVRQGGDKGFFCLNWIYHQYHSVHIIKTKQSIKQIEKFKRNIWPLLYENLDSHLKTGFRTFFKNDQITQGKKITIVNMY